MAKDRWASLCKLFERDDHLPTREAGGWTEKKLFFWHRYIDITTTAMVGHPQWPAGLCYVDLFAGPGVCTLRDLGIRIPGSALIAAHALKPFSKILICEMEQDLADACSARLANSPARGRFQMFVGDCNLKAREIVSKIVPGALTLAFIDPTGLDARFETIAALSKCGRVDLLILFADAYDINRNVELYYQQGASSKLDGVLGPDSNWRESWDSLETRTSANIRAMFADIYIEQLRNHLGYKKFGQPYVIRSGNVPLYRLIYASKHERGLDFWEKTVKKVPSGQMDMFSGE